MVLEAFLTCEAARQKWQFSVVGLRFQTIGESLECRNKYCLKMHVVSRVEKKNHRASLGVASH